MVFWTTARDISAVYAPVQEDEVRKDEEIIASCSGEDIPIQETNFVFCLISGLKFKWLNQLTFKKYVGFNQGHQKSPPINKPLINHC